MVSWGKVTLCSKIFGMVLTSVWAQTSCLFWFITHYRWSLCVANRTRVIYETEQSSCELGRQTLCRGMCYMGCNDWWVMLCQNVRWERTWNWYMFDRLWSLSPNPHRRRYVVEEVWWPMEVMGRSGSLCTASVHLLNLWFNKEQRRTNRRQIKLLGFLSLTMQYHRT